MCAREQKLPSAEAGCKLPGPSRESVRSTFPLWRRHMSTAPTCHLAQVHGKPEGQKASQPCKWGESGFGAQWDPTLLNGPSPPLPGGRAWEQLGQSPRGPFGTHRKLGPRESAQVRAPVVTSSCLCPSASAVTAHSLRWQLPWFQESSGKASEPMRRPQHLGPPWISPFWSQRGDGAGSRGAKRCRQGQSRAPVLDSLLLSSVT